MDNSSLTTLDITLPDGRHYPIHIGQGILSDAKNFIDAPRAIIVTDENVAEHWLEPLQDGLDFYTDTIVLPAGESTKSFELLEILLNELLGLKPDRQTPLIALGGGVVGDGGHQGVVHPLVLHPEEADDVEFAEDVVE